MGTRSRWVSVPVEATRTPRKPSRAASTRRAWWRFGPRVGRGRASRSSTRARISGPQRRRIIMVCTSRRPTRLPTTRTGISPSTSSLARASRTNVRRRNAAWRPPSRTAVADAPLASTRCTSCLRALPRPACATRRGSTTSRSLSWSSSGHRRRRHLHARVIRRQTSTSCPVSWLRALAATATPTTM